MKKLINPLDIQEKTVELMINIYCKGQHKSGKELCIHCSILRDYALKRVGSCVYGNDKPNCRDCKTHCFNSFMREQIINVMRYSGPKIIYKHPILGTHYIIKSFKIRT